MVFRHSDDEFLLTCAEPNVGYLRDLVGRLAGRRSRTSATSTAILAVQGPRSREILAQLAPEVDRPAVLRPGQRQDRHDPGDHLAHRLHRRPRLRGHGPGRRTRSPCSTRSSRPATADGVRPFGEEALLMARIEAGLVLINVEFSSSRFAFTDARAGHRQGARLRLDAQGHRRPTTGRSSAATRSGASSSDKTSRWATSGCIVDWQDYDRLYSEAGLIPPKDETPLDYESMLYDDDGDAGRLRHQPHVLAGAAAAHRPGPGAARARRRSARGSTSS